eukprot:6193637-Pleurochrysis_carterae.AAC.2
MKNSVINTGRQHVTLSTTENCRIGERGKVGREGKRVAGRAGTDQQLAGPFHFASSSHFENYVRRACTILSTQLLASAAQASKSQLQPTKADLHKSERSFLVLELTSAECLSALKAADGARGEQRWYALHP